MKPPAVKATGKQTPSVWRCVRVCQTSERTQVLRSVFCVCAEGLSLLGAYEDSDDEDAGDRSAANTQHNQPGDIDSTLANFMAVSRHC